MYYWIGEDRTGRNRVSCYRSANLRDWEFRNHILTVDSLAKPHPQMPTDLRLRGKGAGCNIERPKVLFCRETGQFVMWMHWELPDNYQAVSYTHLDVYKRQMQHRVRRIKFAREREKNFPVVPGYFAHHIFLLLATKLLLKCKYGARFLR